MKLMQSRLARWASALVLVVLVAAAHISSVHSTIDTAASYLQSAAAFFVSGITQAEIRKEYRRGKVQILIVPGHQPESGGTEFGTIHERDLVVEIAEALAEHLRKNPHYDVMISRTGEEWHPTLLQYFASSKEKIAAFREVQAREMATHVASGRFVLEEEQVYHPAAPSAAALQLYGINLWASEQSYDLTIHLHLNDYAGRPWNRPGRYDGFAVYVPDRQYSNAATSRALGEAVSARLSRYHATSTLPMEDQGVVADRELIAVGANNSADSAALLIEYGYIYEPQFTVDTVRKAALEDYAYQTYLGIQDFLQDPVKDRYGARELPEWEEARFGEGARGPGIYALQTALRYLGYYPPAGRNFSDCPISGILGSCTTTALKAFQHAEGIEETGNLGPKTRRALEEALE